MTCRISSARQPRGMLWFNTVEGSGEELCYSWFRTCIHSTCSKDVEALLNGRKFELRAYHCGLKYLFVQPTLNARQARWLEFICEFDFEIKHIKGKENKVVKALSRKVHEMHVASLSIFQSYLWQQIVNHTAKYEMYVQIKDKLQQ